MDKEEVFNKIDKILRHKELCEKLHEIYTQKNRAYGDSFGRSFDDWGIASAAVRISDKVNRFYNLAKHPDVDHGDEAIQDTLFDLSNYALMTIMELEKQNGDD